jgi:chromosomal replication initiation ATPase DnaA
MRAEEVINEVARMYGVQVEDIMSSKRHRELADCRTVICYTLCEICGLSRNEVSDIIHRRHSDVVYHIAKGKDWMEMPRLNIMGNTAILEIEFMHERESV